MAAAKRKGFFRAALGHRDMRYLLAAMGISGAGDFLYSVALVVHVFEETDSAAWVGAASILRLMPYLLFGAIGGAVADRFERRSVLVTADIGRGVLMLVLALSVALSAPVLALLLITFLSTTLSTAYLPAMTALTPSVVPEKDLAAANAAVSTVDSVALLVGPAVGGLLLGIGPAEIAFVINAATFFVSAGLVRAVRTRSAPGEAEAGESLRSQVLNGIRVMRRTSNVAVLVSFTVSATFVYGIEVVLLVLVAEQLLDIGAEGVGYLFTAAGVGGVLAAGLSSRVAEDRHPGRTMFLIMVSFGIPLLLLSVVRVPLIAYLLLAVEGAGTIVFEVVIVTMLQRTVPRDVLARVSGVLDSLAVGGILLGSLLAPILIEVIGLTSTLVVTGAILPTLAVAFIPKLRHLDVDARRRMDELAPMVEMLDRLGIFEGAPRSTLEAIASSLEEQQVLAGEAVVEQGEKAEAFYVICSGSFEVLLDKGASEPVRLNQLSEGDYFGEIGLLERVPRIATVRADTAGSVYRISGEEFLSAVNEGPSLPASLAETMAGRLAVHRSSGFDE